MANSSILLTRTRNVALALAVTGVLAACGGGGGGGRNNPPTTPPAPPPVNNVVGNTFGVTTAGRLINFNRTSGGIQSATQITGIGNDVPVGFDMRPGNNTLVLVGRSGTTGRIYSVDATTGAATMRSTISVPLAGDTFGVDFNPVPDRLRLVSNTGQNLRIAVETGVATVDGALTLNGAAAAGVTEAGYTNNFGNACRTQLFYLDTANNRVLTTTAPNDGVVTVVGAFGFTTSAPVSGFEIFTDAAGVNTASAVVTVSNIPTAYTVNLTTGALTAPVPIPNLNANENFVGIAAMATPSTVTQAVGELTGLTAANQIFTFNSAQPNKICTGPTAVSGLATGENVVGIDTRPANGMLYGVGATAAGAGRVFVINNATGAISAAQTISATLAGTTFGVDFNPVPDRLRLTSNTGQNLRINVADGVAITDGVTGAAITADAYTNSFGPAAPATTTLYTLNSTTATLNVQNPPNAGTQVPVGSLGLTGGINAVSGFDINGVNNTALAGLAVGTATTTSLYSINLSTGAATVVAGGALGAGVTGTPLFTGMVRGLTYTAVPQATLVGVTANNRLVTFTEAATATLATNVAITGLATGENIIGIDARPANGLLYAVTSQGATYVVNTTTGAATTRVAFTAAQPPVVMTADPFTMIAGTNFGADFNPVPDRLRLVSDAMMGNNLRINVANGATITDGNLNTGVNVTAAAYTNSVTGAVLATTLYTIDTASDRLNIQNPPNNGTQVDVGPLGVDAASISGFDIAGPDPGGLAFAILSTNASPGVAARAPTLFGINLATGAATAMGALDVPAGSTINGFAIPISNTVINPAATTATALLNGTTLVSFLLSTPGTTAMASITGLLQNDTLVGIDFRPANGVLYGLANSGRVYTITGATATLAATLNVPFDPTATSFGVDFNPVPDRLRIVSDTKQNLRANVADGVTVTDGLLNRSLPLPALAFAAAYTNSFAPAPTVTQLYVLDALSNSLEVQNPPNNGVLVLSGKLTTGMGQVFMGVGGFDIAGGDNGLALAALQPVGSAQSNLYRVSLAAGASLATPLAVQVGVNPIGPTGTQPLVGLAIILR